MKLIDSMKSASAGGRTPLQNPTASNAIRWPGTRRASRLLLTLGLALYASTAAMHAGGSGRADSSAKHSSYEQI